MDDAAQATDCEVGDLSGKWGGLDASSPVRVTYTDANLPLFGSDTILGRSVTMHLPDGERYRCATIQFGLSTTVAEVLVTDADDSVSGIVRFEQATDYPDTSPTTVLVDVVRNDLTAAATVDHKWHVHVDPVDWANGGCDSTGGHFLGGVEDAGCDADASDEEKAVNCEVGDLSGKLGKLELSSVNMAYGEANLPLTGDRAILGRSVVIHEEAAGGPRLACGTIAAPWEMVAVADFGEYGSMRFTQAHGSSDTAVNVALEGLPEAELSYHVHVSPVPAGEVGDNAATCLKTNGHFNPFG